MYSAAKRQRTGRHSFHPVPSRAVTPSSVSNGAPNRFTASTERASRLRQAESSSVAEYNRESSVTGQIAGEDFDQIIAAIDMREAGTVGCSYYSAEEEKLYLLEDIKHSNTEILDTLALQIKPTILLVSPGVDHFNQRLEQEDDCNNPSTIYDANADIYIGTGPYLPYQLDVRPTQEFSHSNAKNKLVALEVSAKHEGRFKFLVPHGGLVDTGQLDHENLDFTLQEGRHLRMGSFLDLENKVTLGCAGAILTYLQRRRSNDLIAGDTASASRLYQVQSFEMSTLAGTMFVNARTLAALQILESESHPSMANQGPGKKSSSSKEGLSVYGLFQRFACTPQGKQRLRQIFLRPSVQLDVIHERHTFIGVYLQADNYNPMNKMTKSLRHIRNLRPVMINLQKGISTGSGKIAGFKTTVWSTLLAFAFYGIDVYNALMETSGAHGLDLYNKALHAFGAVDLYAVGRMIQDIVDSESSDEQGRTVVKSGVDRELDRLKDSYDGLDSLLKRVAIEIAATIPASFDIDVNVIYFPQLGFNIAIPLANDGEVAYEGEGWELMFSTENRAYFKDFRMREMDERLGDIYGLICEKEIEIVYDLAQRVLQYDKVLVKASDVCGDIDSLLAMAQGVPCYNLVRPKMVEDNIIKIKGGRHMLQELTVSSYVPNDTFLVGGSIEQSAEHSNRAPETLGTGSSPSMLLLTGPNYSGKSVYMKQVALVVYLAQTGSYIPAESAELGIVDKILVKSNSQDSVSQIQSTFMNDLQQISFDVNHVTDRSLLLIDEFGKGTCEHDGIGLACGILEHLLSLEDPPKVIAATHFHEILEHEFLPSTTRLQLGHMEVRVSEAQEPDNQITYLYNFRMGRSTKSYGTICAALNGISKPIVERANELGSLAARGEDLIAACAELSEEEMQALQEADALARKLLGMDLSTGCEGDVRRLLEDLLMS
ncbi:muts domain V-domain-containing protein [Aspergillus pseudoustus]|uniref:Muts domain V-domain-containing protein n=1 Tax=Aspergillus pseudoustus TaxID=1810923 RepID=A0ABR4J807_9EURO